MRIIGLPLVMALLWLAAGNATAASYTTILQDLRRDTEHNPVGTPVVDPLGAAYVALRGADGRFGLPLSYGSVVKLTPPAPGRAGWVATTLTRFVNYNTEGGLPQSLLRARDGSIYGLANGGPGGLGLLFRLSPPAVRGGDWTRTTPYQFTRDDPDPFFPLVDTVLLEDPAGGLFGVSQVGGSASEGAIFRLAPDGAGGVWTNTMLHRFNPMTEGRLPSGLTLGPDRTLFGALYYTPGTAGKGSIFRLTPPAGGTAWHYETIYGFSGPDGAYPRGRLVLLPSNGALVGTTSGGGARNEGVVFRLAPPGAGGAWSATTLYSFSGRDGKWPLNVVVDRDGLYGTTQAGGDRFRDDISHYGSGTVFRLAPVAGGGVPWSLTTLHSFDGLSDVTYPQSLGGGRAGLFAVASSGRRGGSVFTITP